MAPTDLAVDMMMLILMDGSAWMPAHHLKSFLETIAPRWAEERGLATHPWCNHAHSSALQRSFCVYTLTLCSVSPNDIQYIHHELSCLSGPMEPWRTADQSFNNPRPCCWHDDVDIDGCTEAHGSPAHHLKSFRKQFLEGLRSMDRPRITDALTHPW